MRRAWRRGVGSGRRGGGAAGRGWVRAWEGSRAPASGCLGHFLSLEKSMWRQPGVGNRGGGARWCKESPGDSNVLTNF